MFHAVVAETDDIETGKQEDEEKDIVYSDFVVFNWSRSSCFHLSLWSYFIVLCYTKDVCLKKNIYV